LPAARRRRPSRSRWLNLQEGRWRIFRKTALAGRSFADPDEICYATQVATAQLNARARPWIWGRPPPKPAVLPPALQIHPLRNEVTSVRFLKPSLRLCGPPMNPRHPDLEPVTRCVRVGPCCVGGRRLPRRTRRDDSASDDHPAGRRGESISSGTGRVVRIAAVVLRSFDDDTHTLSARTLRFAPHYDNARVLGELGTLSRTFQPLYTRGFRPGRIRPPGLVSFASGTQ
jgi:hypothetical protein